MKDTIYRADAIEAVRLETGKLGRGLLGRGDILDIISALPSAEVVQGAGRYENAMQKLREMPRYLNGVKAKQIKKIPPEAVQGWIPCSERLPEIDETLRLCDQISDEVLGTDTYGNIRHVYLTNCGYLKPTFCTVEEGMAVDIVAWTPLLEPYEEVER